MAGIDPIRLAQFMVLPGAAEVVEAFAALPPGELRNSAVNHLQVLARTVGWTPPDVQAGEPIGAVVHQAPPRLPSPYERDLSATSDEGRIVERALRGEAPRVIADHMGVPLGVVASLMDAARKAGVVFPGDGDRPVRHTTKGRKLARWPLPEPPYWWQDPASEIWDHPNLLPLVSEDPTGTMGALGPLDRKGFHVMTAAAGRRGMTLRAYLAQKAGIIRRVVDDGEEPRKVADDLRLQPQDVYKLLTKTGNGRMAQLMAGVAPGVEAPAMPPRQGPERWGFADQAELEAARIKVRDLRLTGLGPSQVTRASGYDHQFVTTSLQLWRDRGVKWPNRAWAGGRQKKPAAA